MSRLAPLTTGQSAKTMSIKPRQGRPPAAFSCSGCSVPSESPRPSFTKLVGVSSAAAPWKVAAWTLAENTILLRLDADRPTTAYMVAGRLHGLVHDYMRSLGHGELQSLGTQALRLGSIYGLAVKYGICRSSVPLRSKKTQGARHPTRQLPLQRVQLAHPM
jgi:hypothetical protein